MKKSIQVSIGFIISVVCFALCYTNIFYKIDKVISDPVYQKETNANSSIKIIALDEKTIEEYGDISTWSRDIYANLVSYLNQDTKPSVIAFDLTFASKETESDQMFASICSDYDNIIVGTSYTQKNNVDENLNVDYQAIESVEYPYDALKQNVTYGFTNAIYERDSYIRSAQTSIEYKGETIDSFSMAIYKMYCQKNGFDVVIPDTYSTKNFNNVYTFEYTTNTVSQYETLSLSSVLNGDVPASAFKDCIVVIGAYTHGLQDEHFVPINRGSKMYGVEINANIVEALLEQKTGVVVDRTIFSIVVSLLVFGFYVLCIQVKSVYSTVAFIVCNGLNILLCKTLYHSGLVVDLIQIPIFTSIVYVYSVLSDYIIEYKKRKQITNMFKRYVSEDVVNTLVKQEEVTLGGEVKDIAVLFVDIRGFTSLSERLEPTEVVSVLNKYLSLTTSCVFKYGGSLDKFIGDATMALYNVPLDLEDYEYKAVCTAMEMVEQSKTMGVDVQFGIGIHCGQAVIGNIGCSTRMDYTAIGDTVNTAARLESNAKGGQILISKEMADRLKDRIKVTEIGEIPLKGKTQRMCVYQVDEVLK